MPARLSTLGFALAAVCCAPSREPAQSPAPEPPSVPEPQAPTPRADAPAPATDSVTPCSPSPAGLMACVEEARIARDIDRIAVPRPPGSPGHADARNRCAQRLAAAGFSVELQRYGSGVNVIGTLAGSEPARLVVGAHYDHVHGCSGADDNATGVAAAFEIARVLGMHGYDRSLVVACWDEEERGLRGSLAYARRASDRDEPIATALSLDAIGATRQSPGSQRAPHGLELIVPSVAEQLRARDWRGDFITLIGDGEAEPFLGRFERHAPRAELPVVTLRLNLVQQLALADGQRSDHASFWLQGYSGVLLTDTANYRNPYYHCMAGDDAPETIDVDFTTRVTRTLTATIAESLRPRR